MWFGDHRISSLLPGDDVVPLAPSSQDLHWGLRISTSKSEVMVRSWKKVASFLQVEGEILPQVEKHLRMLFMSLGCLLW